MKDWILGWDWGSAQIRQQILNMVTMAACGLVIALARCVYLRIVEGPGQRSSGQGEPCCRKLSSITAGVLEIAFWIGAGFAAAEFLYYCAYGELSFHAMAALAAGFFAGKRIFRIGRKSPLL